MKAFLRLYKTLLLLNWNALLEYRSDLFARIFTGLMFSIYHVAAALLITTSVSSVFGWSRNELILLAATYSVFIGIFHTIISRNMGKIAEDVFYGRFDYFLLKPLDSQLTASIWIIDYVALTRIIFGLSLTIYMVMSMHIDITWAIVIGYICMLIVGLSILYSIWLSVISLTIIFPRLSNVVSLLYNMTNTARYPQEMYSKLPPAVGGFLLPYALIMTTPTKVLIGTFTPSLGFEVLVLCIVFAILSRKIWQWSLSHYASAS